MLSYAGILNSIFNQVMSRLNNFQTTFKDCYYFSYHENYSKHQAPQPKTETTINYERVIRLDVYLC